PSGGTELVFNAAPHARGGVAAGAAAPAPASVPAEPAPRAGGGFVLDNGLLRVEIDARGLVVSAYDIGGDREAIAPGEAANLLQLHPDFPNQWDAWDVDKFYRNTGTDLTAVDELSADGGAVRVVRGFGSSRVTQSLSLPGGVKRLDIDTEVDWHETEKFLKLAFPLDVKADRYASETQFGHVHRPTHQNTSWEWAKFEACNHRFVHLEEPGWGVALVNDSTYGHDVTRQVRTGAGAGTTTTVRASLLRAPRYPDPETDQGVHRFHHALAPGATIGDAVREGYRANLPERHVTGSAEVAPLVSVDNDAVVVSAVKLADDRSGDLVVRVYEANGGRARATVSVAGRPLGGVARTDLLERPLADAERPAVTAEGVELALRPFEMVTLRLARA
ncbi:glycoside hydrolase family 38 C-terminal domain-containing protein, partial [Streptomyces fuscigenes]|uniref:glycoside hydrolase family 38 C-terminal domain-containing protein n=1 Tax=Streptomyces fuscigenes TaxID=1528880 RepID=UPI001F303DA8